jgi:hypothetical protein
MAAQPVSFENVSCISPLMLADRMLSLAADADRAGLRRPAERLLRLAYAVYDEKPARG